MVLLPEKDLPFLVAFTEVKYVPLPKVRFIFGETMKEPWALTGISVHGSLDGETSMVRPSPSSRVAHPTG